MKITLLLLLSLVSTLAFGQPILRNRFTTNSDGTTINGNVINNLPLSGLQQGGASASQVLGWSGSAWQPQTIASSGGGSNLNPLFNFNCDSRTATNQENGINMWPYNFMTNVINAAVFPSISQTNFFIQGSPGAQLTQYAQNLSNNPTGYLLPLIIGQKGYSFVDGGVNDSSFTAAQLEVVYSNIYVINKAHGYFTVVIDEYPAQPWPSTGFYLTQVAVNRWLVGQKGVAWDFYVPFFEGMTSNMFGDVAHPNEYGASYEGDMAFKSLFGTQNGIVSVGGQQANTNGFVMGTNSNVPLTFAINGQSGFWNSNGPNGNATYLRTSTPGATNFSDQTFSGLAALSVAGQNFSAGLDVSTLFNVNGPASGVGAKESFNALSSFGWDIGIAGATQSFGPLGCFYIFNRQTSKRTTFNVTTDAIITPADLTVSGNLGVTGTSTFSGVPAAFATASASGPYWKLQTDGSGHNYRIGTAGASDVPAVGSLFFFDEQSGKFDAIFDTSGNLALTNNENVHGALNVTGLSTFSGATNTSSNGVAGNLVVGGAATIGGAISNGMYHWTGSTGTGFVLQDTLGTGDLSMAASSASGGSNLTGTDPIVVTPSAGNAVISFTGSTTNQFARTNGTGPITAGIFNATNALSTNGVLIQPGATNQIVIIGNEAGNTTSNGLFLSNPQVASTGNQMFSPAVTWDAQGWKTTATAASQDVQFRSYVLPIQGAANPTANWVLESSINGAAFVNQLRFGSAGGLTVSSGGISATSGGSSLAGTTFSGSISFSPTTLGIAGTTAADNVSSGKVGEFVSSLVASGSAVSLTTATPANVTSISLTAGDWDVEGSINYIAATATVTTKQGGISTTTATLPTDGSEVFSGVQMTLISVTDGLSLPRKRINVSSTTTVFLVAQATFSAGTVTAYGSINARRVR